MIFIFPTELEASGLRRACPDAQIVICGVGMASTAATIAGLRGSFEQIIMAGIAGSYDAVRHPVCEVVEVVSECIYELPERFRVHYTCEPQWALPAVSSNTVSSSAQMCEGCDIENMEGAAAMAVSRELGVKFSQIRAISNRVGEPIERWRIEEAVDALTEVLMSIIERK